MVLERRKVLYQIKCISPIQPDTNNVKALKNVKSVNINHLNIKKNGNVKDIAKVQNGASVNILLKCFKCPNNCQNYKNKFRNIGKILECKTQRMSISLKRCKTFKKNVENFVLKMPKMLIIVQNKKLSAQITVTFFWSVLNVKIIKIKNLKMSKKLAIAPDINNVKAVKNVKSVNNVNHLKNIKKMLEMSKITQTSKMAEVSKL